MSAVPGLRRLRAVVEQGLDPQGGVRKGLRAGGQLLDSVRRDPRIVRELIAGFTGLGSESETAPAPTEHPVPPGLSEYVRTAHAHQELETGAAATLAYLAQLSRLADWVSFHGGWRGDAPGAAAVGVEFTQIAKFMGIPADLAWIVTEVGDSGLALRGTGPQGLVLGLWITVAPNGSGSIVYVDAGLSGQPIEGPLGATVARGLADALRDSLAGLPAAIAAARTTSSSGRAAAKAVRHRASGTVLAPHTPVVIGVGQVVARTPDPGYPDPSQLAVRALRAAAADCGAGPGLLARADAVFAVAPTSWQYRDLGALVAAAVGAGGVETVQSSPFGGDGGQLVLNEAAAAIAAGTYELVLVTGAEAGATQAAAQRAGIDLDWPVQDSGVAPTRTVGIDKPANNAAETAVGLQAPITMYALLESANRGRLARTPAEHAAAVAELWSRLSAVAAGNPNAWQPQEFSPAQIATVTEANRMICAPYTKLECANLSVDMASGIIVASAAAAEAAGVPQDKWVFLHAGASGSEEWFVSERAELAASPAIAALGAAVFEHAGISAEDLTHIDLYACFPVAVQIAARELGLPIDDLKRPLSVTGGLTFGGGPGNNYGGHAVATLVQRLRAEPESFGLATSLGWYLTKHALGVYSATPPRRAYRHLTPVIEHPPARPARTGYEGEAVVEAYTLPYGRDGQPEAAIVSLLTPAGERVLLRTTDSEVLTGLTDADWLRRPVTVSGDTVSVTGGERVELPSPPPAPVLIERRDHVMIITINRPAARNAIDLATALGLERAIDAFEADPNARVAILTGAGGFFSAGMDLKAAARGEVPVTEKRGILGIVSVPPSKPLIAAVEGPALAGGCELALAADLIVAAQDSTFGIPEVKRGLVAVGGGVLRLSQRLPRALAMELALTGDPITATRAAQIGLINQVVDPGQALEAALVLAERIAVNAPLSIQASKQIIEQCPDWSVAEAFGRQGQVAAAALSSQDAAEGMRAFVEKRPPVWRGR
ncbi:crotonase/enoyl-CoA hydratase family protein [Nocardia sp. CDC160]|uniref:crotonase/enoyl-CoA hydratase family protein n=1 Tax=Nocardia sp. CDC160 TaxID=3112166 RepID=UPI002DB6F134|nr:crotonase/enoyl-CoA hydratase family protein [Nocardia sp. CDC160]MEC3917372.1 crotonase/enoyl-CoA hydratase family protein [Nocardia sp. CDC160]